MALFVVFITLAASLLGGFLLPLQQANAATTSTLNFQARLESSTGAIVPDGLYNVEFKLYTASAVDGGETPIAGSCTTNPGAVADEDCVWTERYYDSDAGGGNPDNRVSVQNGYLTVNLGSQTSFPGTINWDQDLWIAMNIGGTTHTGSPTWDGEMSPRMKLTGVPYAFRAGMLATAHTSNGFTSTLALLQPTVGSQTFQVLDQTAGGTYTICVQNATTALGGCAASTGAAGYIQNQNASAQTTSNFWISGSGRADSSFLAPAFDVASAGTLSIGDATATTINIATNNTTHAINIGTGATGVNTVIIGTTNSTSSTTIRAGSGGITLTGAVTGSSTITGTTLNGTTGINTGASAGTQRIDASGNLLNIVNATMSGNFTATGGSATNYFSGVLGLGTTSPQTAANGSALTLAHDKWITGVDSAGTGFVNMFKTNAANQIQVGAALNLDGGLVLPTDGGPLTLADMAFTNAQSAGTDNSYTFGIGQANALTIFGENDGSGNAQNVRVAIGSSITPAFTLDVGGTIGGSSSLTLGTASATNGSIILQNASNANTLTLVSGATAGSFSLTLPTGDGASGDCLKDTNGSGVLGFASCMAAGSADYIQNQNSGAQTTSNFWISGTGRADTSFTTPLLDTATGVALNIGTTNATVINLNEDTSVAAGKSITLVGGLFATRPASPTAGMLYYDSTSNQLLTYNGTKWMVGRDVNTKIVAAANSTQSAKDIADYIADGNAGGAANGDQVEINQALDAVETGAIGGSVYLMEGTYVADAAIRIPNNVTLMGAGNGTVVELGDIDTSADLIENKDQTTGAGVVIKDMKLDGRSDLNTAGTQQGIELTNMGLSYTRDGARISGIFMTRFRTTGIILTTSDVTTISDSKLFANGSNNITLTTNSNHNTISNNVIQDGTNGLSLISSSDSNTITGNNISSASNDGIVVNSSDYNTISGNYIDASGSNGIELTSTASNENLITGNTIYASTSAGMLITGTFTIVSGNKVYDSSASFLNHGIQVSGDDNSIIGNYISDSACSVGCDAMEIGGNRNLLADNRFTGPAATPPTLNVFGTGTIYSNQQDSSGNFINRSQGGGTSFGKTSATVTVDIQGGIKTAQLSTPAAPSLAVVGTTGSTTLRYQITALDGLGETLGSTIAQVTNANATLSAGNRVDVTWAQIGGAVQYKVYRCSGGGCTPALLATVAGNLLAYADTANGSPSGALPTANTTGNASIAGTLQSTSAVGNSYIMSALGLGTVSPQAVAISAVTLAHDRWISAVDSAGTGYVNMFKTNASNQIQVGAALAIDGSIILPTNGGQLTLVDLGIDSSSAASTKHSYSFRVGSANVMTIYGEADGSGNAQNTRVAIGTSITPSFTLDVGGTIGGSSSLTLGTASTTMGSIIFRNSSNANTATLISGATAGNFSLTLPTADGASGDCLKDTNGSGVLGFASCASAVTLQTTYDNSSPGSILMTTGKDFTITSPDVATDPSIVFNLQCSTCSASGGRFAVQDAGADIFLVNPDGSIRIGSSSHNVTFAASTYQPTYSGNARRTKTIRMSPEYAGAVITGTSTAGTMTSDFCSGSSRKNINASVCGGATTTEHTYYEWVSTSSGEVYDIYIYGRLPSDFDGFASSTSINMSAWRTDTSVNSVKLSLYNSSGTECGTGGGTEIAGAATTWVSTALGGDETGCTFSADEDVIWRVRVTADTSDTVRAGAIWFSYLSKF